jgi:cobalt/nickel transport system permease protein
MKLGLDQYADLKSPIHRWEQRSKLVALIALIFAFAFTNDLVLVPFMIGITAILYGMSRLPIKFLLRRLRYPGLFIGAVLILVLLASRGEPILTVGPLSITQSGLETVLLIAARFLCIITVSLVLFGTAPILTSVRAMRTLRLPDVMVDMTLLSYRYLEEVGKTQTTMQHAMQLRGFESNRFGWNTVRTYSGLAGSLLIRSFDRSQRVHQAMRLRGYGEGHGNALQDDQEFALDVSEANRTSRIAFWLTLLTAAGLIAATIVL